MITLVEGSIGSGKTYFVISEVLRKYFRWDDDNVCYKMNVDNEVEIFTNVDGFRYGNDLKQAVLAVGGVDNFFTLEYQREKTNNKRHLYVIDEAQIWFPRKYYNVSVFNFFQYSRHFGIDIYFITQDVYSLARELQTLNEYHIKVVKRSYSFMGEFRYHYMVGNEILKRRTLKSDAKIFAQYRSSMAGAGSHDAKRFTTRYMMYIIILCLMIGFGGYGFIWMYTSGSRNRIQNVKIAGPEVKKDKVYELSVKKVASVDGYTYMIDERGKIRKKVKIAH